MSNGAPDAVPASEARLRRFATWAPVFLFIALTVVGAAAWFVGREPFRILMASELGIVENGTVLFCLIGVYVALRLVFAAGQPVWARPWWAIFAIGLFLLGGEEASWGQHWFGWTAPEDFAALNIQAETNLHNLSEAAEQVPKTLLTIATLATGIIWPLWHARRPAPLKSAALARIWPPAFLWPSAAFGVAIRIVERLIAAVPDHGVEQALIKTLKEGSELFLILYILLYLLDAARRLRAAPNAL